MFATFDKKGKSACVALFLQTLSYEQSVLSDVAMKLRMNSAIAVCPGSQLPVAASPAITCLRSFQLVPLRVYSSQCLLVTYSIFSRIMCRIYDNKTYVWSTHENVYLQDAAECAYFFRKNEIATLHR